MTYPGLTILDKVAGWRWHVDHAAREYLGQISNRSRSIGYRSDLPDLPILY